MSLWKAVGKAGKAVGSAMIESMEDQATRHSKDKRFSDEQRQSYSSMSNGLNNLRTMIDDDEDDD